MSSHPKEAHKFLKDRVRASWHNEALWYVRQKRDRATKATNEWETLREEAKRVKAHTIKHLGYYLSELEKNAKANGIEVLWANDAKDFREVVSSILKKHNAKQVVKSKSMLTEECGLNPYLEAQGIEVTDTDLGERIVQLAKDRPSHIVLPAIHLKKEEVASIFAKELKGSLNNSDPKYLTRLARKHLREKFLNADVAITGVNFALAKEGGFVVCTNEGNADLATALCDIHIACMGLEKVIPSSKELGLFTRILARSATGQAITTYTSHFLKPKDGSKIYLIIVDNGRSELLKSQYSELLRCIRCGACMNTCPVYRLSGGHSYNYVIPGPIGSALAGAKEPKKEPSLAFACSLCGSCNNVCPVKIDLDKTLYREREVAIKEYPLKFLSLKFVAYILKNRAIYNLFISILKITPKFLLNSRLNPWANGREMIKPAKKSFSQIYKELKDER